MLVPRDVRRHAALAATAWRTLPRRGADPPAAVDAGTPAAFALADCRARLFDGSPAIAVMLTRPLGRAQEWGRLVQAKEGADGEAGTDLAPRWVLGDNPRGLDPPNATPDRTFRVRVSPGLAAADGTTLPAAADCTAKREGVPEAFFFASRGVVLPAGQNGGLPVVTAMAAADVE